MPTFKVSAMVTVSCFTEVVADTEEEAKEILTNRGLAEFHIDGSFPVDECWHFEADGEPFNVRLEGTEE